ncbi:peptidase-like protein [Calothrix sp. NIES-4071]|nr:peptidase-like protein [Calothrix sp. NIES-4071]BAZ56861.1 peptidase-like protein [Calothrix sp. NIES-4105]
MKLSSLIQKAVSVVAISTVAALSFCEQSKAVVFSGNSNGFWGEPYRGINIDAHYKGVGTNAFTWGLAFPNNDRFGTPANSLTFKGTQLNSSLNSLFKLGDLTYFNGTVPLYTSVEQVPLQLQVSFQSPVAIKENFNFDLQLLNVLNDPDKPLNSVDNADFVLISPSKTNRSFTYNGAEYSLELTGFSKDGGLTSTSVFSAIEGDTTTAEIYGRITYVPPAEKVPEPGIVIGLSSLGFYMLVRKKRGSTKA